MSTPLSGSSGVPLQDGSFPPRQDVLSGRTGRGPVCVLAFDVGLRRIGVAAGDTLTGTARPRGTVRAGREGPDWVPDWDGVAAHVKALVPGVLVVGLPLHADGKPSALAGTARDFAAELGRRFGVPVSLVDEHGSSAEAQEGLRQERSQGDRRRRVSKEDIDSQAACVILSRWLAGEGVPL